MRWPGARTTLTEGLAAAAGQVLDLLKSGEVTAALEALIDAASSTRAHWRMSAIKPQS